MIFRRGEIMVYQMETIITSVAYVREETVTRRPWNERRWLCRIGIHSYGEVTDDDIQAASQVCQCCGKISHHSTGFMLECIRHRNNHLLVRTYAK